MIGHSRETLSLHESKHPSAGQGTPKHDSWELGKFANFSPWWEAAQPYVDLVKTAIQP